MENKEEKLEKYDKLKGLKLCCHIARVKLTDSTIHGCGFNTIMWVFFGLAASAYLIYLMTTSLIEFFRYEITVKIDTHQDFPATFPAVTICNANTFNEQYANSYIRNVSSQANCFDLTNGDDFAACYNSTDISSAFDDFRQRIKRIVGNDETQTENNYSSLGYDLATDMLVSCTYNGQKCNANNFKQYWDYYYGNCYTFNYDFSTSDGFLKTSASGSKNGLKLQLVVSTYTLANLLTISKFYQIKFNLDSI